MIINDTQVICRTDEILIDSNEVLNPLKHQSKGRLSAKRLKSSTESGSKTSLKSKDKGEQISNLSRKYSLCEENGHYCSTCSKN